MPGLMNSFVDLDKVFQEIVKKLRSNYTFILTNCPELLRELRLFRGDLQLCLHVTIPSATGIYSFTTTTLHTIAMTLGDTLPTEILIGSYPAVTALLRIIIESITFAYFMDELLAGPGDMYTKLKVISQNTDEYRELAEHDMRVLDVVLSSAMRRLEISEKNENKIRELINMLYAELSSHIHMVARKALEATHERKLWRTVCAPAPLC